MIKLQDCPGEKCYQSHKLLTFQMRKKKRIQHYLQRHAPLNDFFGLLKSNYQLRILV